MPRIVLDARYLRGQHGGVATYTAALVEHLPALLPQEHFVLLRHPAAPGRLSEAPNVEEWPLGGDPNHPWTLLGMGRWLARRLGAGDLYHAPYRMLPLDPPRLSVLTMHDAMQIVCPELVLPSPVLRFALSRYWRAAVVRSLRRAGRVIAVSAHSAADSIAVEPSCAPRMRVTLLGVAPAFRRLDEAEALRLSAAIVPPGRRFLLLLGGGYRNKNHEGGVRAFAAAVRPEDDVHLVVIQRERELASGLAALAARRGLAERVHVRGGVAAEALVALYNRALALVFPSLYEGFGLPVLEAMAAGCPVVCSNLTSLPEVAGDAALSCDPRDEAALAAAVRRVVDDAELRRDLARRGLARAARFSWLGTARATVAVYRELAPWIGPPAGDAPVL
ncbi:MAG: glycosyltransferase family 4 protein [Polyangiaceae bacterium]|nr:glycosyltransferase family 4 protein [Polyangiaceae bacterium]